VIDSTAIDEMKTDINKEIAKVRSGIAATPRGATTVELQQNLHNLQEAIREVDKLKEETKKVPQESGGVNKAGTFDTSKVK
jgi:flagellar motility protein MotE (MotC chaperone)